MITQNLTRSGFYLFYYIYPQISDALASRIYEYVQSQQEEQASPEEEDNEEDEEDEEDESDEINETEENISSSNGYNIMSVVYVFTITVDSQR